MRKPLHDTPQIDQGNFDSLAEMPFQDGQELKMRMRITAKWIVKVVAAGKYEAY
jgi:hypothetical protein